MSWCEANRVDYVFGLARNERLIGAIADELAAAAASSLAAGGPAHRFDDERMYVLLQDGREISVPLWWYPRLLHATPAQRNRWEILPFGDALHWPAIDEDLDVRGS